MWARTTFLSLLLCRNSVCFLINRYPTRKFLVSSSSATTSSTPVPPVTSPLKQSIIQQLSLVIDPDLQENIVSLGFVKHLTISPDNDVSFVIQLTTPACPVKDKFRQECYELVSSIPGVKSVDVTMTAQPPRPVGDKGPVGISRVSNIIAVSSCKGGVGKSTTSVNLAFALRNQGARVGIFDADVFGPSLPTMVRPDNEEIRFIGQQIAPLECEGVKLMSFGFVNDGTATMRGPMVTQLLQQFVGLTNWGELDYLVVDMPPGTGDIQLTLCQMLNITAAVVVTTPQKLCSVDVEKGIEMFNSVNVPSIAIVENMAYLEERGEVAGGVDWELARREFCKSSDLTENEKIRAFDSIMGLVKAQQQDKHKQQVQQNRFFFGRGNLEELATRYDIEHMFRIPLKAEISRCGDEGTPFVLEEGVGEGEGEEKGVFANLASCVVTESSKLRHEMQKKSASVVYDEKKQKIIFKRGEKTSEVEPADMRGACRCASCVEEFTGRQILDVMKVDKKVRPVKIRATGNYAVSVDWSDAHRSLYPWKDIERLLVMLKI